ncbi:hypothetical protein KUTeg_013124 [Tegillarca granosa]|uniref:Solute carrier organic anion transporter family member n=1 Tax=Tegillarca granosa TaxID=220873 RepID=A0ABQ9EXZ2_TEGGR|nr:hypothetical protein KUTeg_013124 [Tegillarca granosa]
MPVFVFWCFIMCFLEGFAVNGLANAALTSIEKQFKLPSTKSALITSSQDIGSLIVILFVSFVGGKYHKSTWVAAGSVIMGIGSVLFMVPHFAEKYIYPEVSQILVPFFTENTFSSSSLCNTDLTDSSSKSNASFPCTDSQGDGYLGVFMVAQMVHGVGYTPMLTLGTVYIDENESHTLAAVYIVTRATTQLSFQKSLTYAAAAIGVAAGFFAGGQIMENIYVDYDRVDQSSLGFGARDPRWIGAWWVGFIATAVGFFAVSIPLFGYPKSLRDNPDTSKDEDTTKEKERSANSTDVISTLKEGLFSFLKTLVKLRIYIIIITNPIFMCLTLGGCAETLIISGVGAFSFKYLIEQFSMNFDDAGTLIGALILTGSLGMILGGVLIRIFHLELLGMTRLNVMCTLVSALLGISFLAGCPEVPLVGLEVPLNNKRTVAASTVVDDRSSDLFITTGYIDTCQGVCQSQCTSIGFSPVCGKDGNVYYSPCHAGCTSNQGGPFGTYGNCSCIASSLQITPYDPNASATGGKCPDNCTNLAVLAPCLFIAMVAVLTATTPTSMATLRCVDEDVKPFALGLQWMFLRLLGTIPGPVLIGSIIDRTCQIWQSVGCGSSGFCTLYSHNQLSLGVMGWWIGVSLVASFFFFLASIFATRLKKSHNINS